MSSTQVESLVKGRRPEIQGLRAVAVLIVVLYHIGLPVRGGFIGVDVFYVISGFVISGVIVREIHATGTFRPSAFFVRRARRLLPALAVMSVVTSLMSGLLLSPFGSQQQAGATGGGASIWVSNAVLYKITSSYFSVQVQGNPFLHTWSLGVEEQFYLFFPILVLTALWLRRKCQFHSTLIVLMLGVGIISFVGQLLILQGFADGFIPNSQNFVFYLSPARAWEFAAGALLAIWPREVLRLGPVVRVGGVLVVLVGGFFISSTAPFPGTLALVPVVGTLLIIAGGTLGRGFLESRVMGWLGDISYSWYLWHWPLIVFSQRLFPGSTWAAAVAGLLGLGAAWLSFNHVEQRYRRHVTRAHWKDLRLVAVGVGAPAVVCGALLVGSLTSWGSPTLAFHANQLTERPLHERTCLSDTPVSKRDLTQCVWGVTRPGKPIYLVGDSNAQMYTEGVLAAGEKLDRPVYVLTMGGCAVSTAQARISDDYAQLRLCTKYNADLLIWLTKQRHGTVVVAAANESINDPTVALRLPGKQWHKTDRQAKEEVWRDGTVEVLHRIEAAGQQPLLVKIAPHFVGGDRPWWHPVECSNLVVYRDPADCGISVPLSEIAKQESRPFDADTDAAQLAGVPSLDLRPVLCPNGVCLTYRDKLWIYRDGLHISPRESAKLGPVFARALRGVGA